jgi:hypothetical protein
MGEAREPDQADFDLERFIDMFDEALTSKDERVVNALRSLIMMTILTKSEARTNPLADRNTGPLRRLFEDVYTLNRRVHDLSDSIRQMEKTERVYKPVERAWDDTEKYTLSAANQIAQKIDQDAINKLKIAATAKGLYNK